MSIQFKADQKFKNDDANFYRIYWLIIKFKQKILKVCLKYKLCGYIILSLARSKHFYLRTVAVEVAVFLCTLK